METSVVEDCCHYIAGSFEGLGFFCFLIEVLSLPRSLIRHWFNWWHQVLSLRRKELNWILISDNSL